jgi:hypothetical protein
MDTLIIVSYDKKNMLGNEFHQINRHQKNFKATQLVQKSLYILKKVHLAMIYFSSIYFGVKTTETNQKAQWAISGLFGKTSTSPF